MLEGRTDSWDTIALVALRWQNLLENCKPGTIDKHKLWLRHLADVIHIMPETPIKIRMYTSEDGGGMYTIRCHAPC